MTEFITHYCSCAAAATTIVIGNVVASAVLQWLFACAMIRRGEEQLLWPVLFTRVGSRLGVDGGLVVIHRLNTCKSGSDVCVLKGATGFVVHGRDSAYPNDPACGGHKGHLGDIVGGYW